MFVATPTRVTVAKHFSQQARTLWSTRLKRTAVPMLDRASSRLQLDVPWLEAALGKLDPTLSLHTVRAEVVSVVDETADTKSYWLRPNARFGTHRPGSYVTLKLTIGGRSVRRSYSLSSAPRADGLVCLTVKRVEGGLVSNWLADHVRPGHILELSPPTGQFVLPTPLPEKLLMLSAGSGITPVMAMLQQLTAVRRMPRIVFLHFARTPQDIIFFDELKRIAAACPQVQLGLCVESTSSGHADWSGALGRFSADFLAEHAPDFRELDTFMCGPAGFMQTVIRHFEAADADLARLRYERFDAGLDLTQFLHHTQLIRFVRSGTESMSNRPRTILEEAETVGLSVEYGCRAGNCGACRCRKISGVVVDVTTGLELGANKDFIFPCVSVARGTVEVDL